jgi:hypothetical protein
MEGAVVCLPTGDHHGALHDLNGMAINPDYGFNHALTLVLGKFVNI